MKIELKQPYTAREIKRITGADLSADMRESDTVRYIATHSDEVERDTLFLAFEGAHTSGICFHREVLERGGYIMAEKKLAKGFCVFSVMDAMYRLADAHLLKLKKLKHTVCITGSVGKTTTKEILLRMLSHDYFVHATEGNQNSEIGLALTVLSAPTETELLLLEAGMNHAGELARISDLVHPNLIIITNIGHAHIGNLGSREKIASAKKEILCSACEGALTFIPANEPLLSDIKSAKSVGLTDEGDYTLKMQNETALFLDGNQAICDFPENMKDPAMLSASAFALAAALSLGIKKTQLQREISKLSANIFRQKYFSENGLDIIFDAYNASFESVLNAILLLRKKEAKMRALVLGDMLELGEHADMLNQRLAQTIAKERDILDLLFLFGENAQSIARYTEEAGFPHSRIFINPSMDRPQDTAAQILGQKRDGMCVIIKGARGMRMERIFEMLTKTKGDIT